jgi:ABC-type sugar transport system permease subunit
MNIAIHVILLVVGIAVVLALVALPIVLIFRGKYRAGAGQLETELAAETIIRPLEKGNYRGATAPGFPGVKNSGRIALTRRRVVFLTLTGTTISVPLDTITGLRLAKVFKGSVVGGWTHLVIRTAAGEIGFYVPDTNAWLQALGETTGLTPDPVT